MFLKGEKPSLVKKVFIAVAAGFATGIICILIRSNLGGVESPIWSTIDQIFFVDITSEEGVAGIGLFYIVSQLFMRGLQLAIVPLVMTSLSLALCSLADPKRLGRVAKRTLVTFFCLYVAAATLAALAAYAVKSSGGFDVALPDSEVTELATVDAYNPLAIIVNLIPSNLFSALSSNNSVLSICFVAIVLGLCMARMGDRCKPLMDLIKNINEIIEKCLNFIINRFSPVAIYCMVTRGLAVYGTEYLRPTLVWMVTTVVVCLALVVVLYPAAIFLATRLNPLPFIRKTLKVALFGAATQSSAVTLPLNMKTCVEELGCSEEISSFVLPTGMAMQMNGTTCMQIISVTFIATAAHIDVTPSMLVVAAFLSISCAVSTPPIPMAGVALVYVILMGLGLDTPLCMIGYSLVMAMNYVPGMSVMPMNVIDDAAVDVIVSFKEHSFDKNTYLKK